jgi:hypothetical protein
MPKNLTTALPLATIIATILLTFIYCLFSYIPRTYLYALLTLILGIILLVLGIYLAIRRHGLIGLILTELGVGITASVCAQVIMAAIGGM